MNRPILFCTLVFAIASAAGAQDASQSTAYQGMSTPPPDDTIVATEPLPAKPPAGQPVEPQPQTPVRETAREAAPAPAASAPDSDPDSGIVQVRENEAAPLPRQPALTTRSAAPDPDSDIVHPGPPRPGEIEEGTTMRVRLVERLSTTLSEKGEPFHGRLASDILAGGQVVIPTGAEIEGRVSGVSSGRLGGHGSMYLVPETVILPNGARLTFHAALTGTPGSRTRVGNEGEVLPPSRIKRDGIEYGGAVGGGVVAGAMIAGPVGALTGGLIGAGVVTTHLLISHPQATLEPGSVLLFTLSEPLMVTPETPGGN